MDNKNIFYIIKYMTMKLYTVGYTVQKSPAATTFSKWDQILEQALATASLSVLDMMSLMAALRTSLVL